MDYQTHILIVDDVTDNIEVVMNRLKEEGYDFSFATDGEQALSLVQSNPFDLILLDIMMPGLSGFEVCQKLKNDPQTQEIPVIFLTAKVDIDAISRGFELGAVDYVTKPFNGEELIARVRTHLELSQAKKLLKQNNLTLQENLTHRTQRFATELEENQKEMIFLLAELMETTSDETGQHIRRVAEFSRLLAYYDPSMSEEDEYTLFHAAPMHDIGKIKIPIEILNKPDKLTESEFEIVKTHTKLAYEMMGFSDRALMKASAIIALQHHERWDGRGYPNQLKSNAIHPYARIVALADVFDALANRRHYKAAWPLEEVITYINEQRGKQFEPKLVDLFNAHQDEFAAILEKHRQPPAPHELYEREG
jgi:putative two-component system response regulator